MITNKLNGSRYVGQTVRTLSERWARHCDAHSDCHYLRSAIEKYGKNNFEIKVIVRCNSLEEMNHRETYYIKLFNTMAPNGYNIVPGGNRGPSRKGQKNSEESKLKVAATLKGHSVSEDSRRKMSFRKMGKPTWNTGTKGIMKSNSGTFGNGRVAPNKGRKKTIIDGKVRYVQIR
jgi:group I intron endonuclease